MATHIYHGPWINFGNGGYITGATITLSDRSGGLLTSFIATFVTLVGAQLWKILAFAIHQIRSTTEPEDALFHQQQTIWRNTTTPGGTSWTFLQQAWYWRNKASRSFLRTVSWSLFSVVYLLIFGLAAVFSSEISKAPGSDRLLVGGDCGFWTTDVNSSSAEAALYQKTTNDSQVATTYSRACYGGSYDALQCNRFSKPNITWTSDANATCPFQSGMCYWSDTAAFQMTSQLLDSQEDLGINTPKKHRLQFQKRTTCAPVHQRGYVNITSELVPQGDGYYYNDTWWNMMYGPWSDKGPVNTSSPNYLNYTFFYNTQGFPAGVGYQLNTVWSLANDTTSLGWRPIPEIAREDADVSLYFLQPNAIRYNQPVDDPWFAAHYPIVYNRTGNPTQYWADFYVTTLGCAEQYRFCNPQNGRCGPYGGYMQSYQQFLNKTFVNYLGLTLMQQMTGQRMNYGASWSAIYQNVNYRGEASLRAQSSIVMDTQTINLPSTQWQIEVSSWFNTGLAAFQQKIVEYATGPSSVLAGATLYSPAKQFNDLQAEYQCYAQIIKDGSDTMSFSILGMSILFIVGFLIIFTSLIIDRVVALFQQWFKFNLHGARAWALDDKLQMQKQVLEKSGLGRWKHACAEDAVPVTVEKSKFRRFVPDQQSQLFGERNPDSPTEQDFYSQRTEYVGDAGVGSGGYEDKVPNVYVARQ